MHDVAILDGVFPGLGLGGRVEALAVVEGEVLGAGGGDVTTTATLFIGNTSGAGGVEGRAIIGHDAVHGVGVKGVEVALGVIAAHVLAVDLVMGHADGSDDSHAPTGHGAAELGALLLSRLAVGASGLIEVETAREQTANLF